MLNMKSAPVDPLEAASRARRCCIPMQNFTRLAARNKNPSNVFVDLTWTKGDVEAGFRDADLIIENTFTAQRCIKPTSSLILRRAGA
jgi:hypothetical protein